MRFKEWGLPCLRGGAFVVGDQPSQFVAIREAHEVHAKIPRSEVDGGMPCPKRLSEHRLCVALRSAWCT